MSENFQDFNVFFDNIPESEDDNVFYDDISEYEDNDVNDFFDNIPEYEEDFTFLQDQNSFEAAYYLFQESTSSSNSEEWENDSAIQSSIITESTEAENDISIPQTTDKTGLSACAVVDIIDERIKCCGETENLRGLWQLVGMWQLDKSTVEGVDGNLDKLGFVIVILCLIRINYIQKVLKN